MILEISSSVDDEVRQRAAQRLTAGQLCSSWQHHECLGVIVIILLPIVDPLIAIHIR